MFLGNLLPSFKRKCNDKISVKTKSGAIRGTTLKNKMGETIFSFRGIPYGKPPVGLLRFKRSSPVEPWEGEWDGTDDAPKPLQPNVLLPDYPSLGSGTEDCLYLNVYSKKIQGVGEAPLPKSQLSPVLVFIPGGTFLIGSCEAMMYGPEILLERELVLVCLHYRLGALGWLSLQTEEAPGNLGLHDQYLVLLWVRDNIAVFGGDPGNISLMGVSAGAMCIMCHLISPFSRGLFHRAISLSGSYSSVLLHNDRAPRYYATALALRLGYSGDKDNSRDLLAFLQTVSSQDILAAQLMFKDWDHVSPMPWVALVDSGHCSHPFMPLSFKEAVRRGKFDNKVRQN